MRVLDKPRVVRVTVYGQSTPDFVDLREVATRVDVFSHVSRRWPSHTHPVGVYQLPKNAAIEVDMIVALHSGA